MLGMSHPLYMLLRKMQSKISFNACHYRTKTAKALAICLSAVSNAHTTVDRVVATRLSSVTLRIYSPYDIYGPTSKCNKHSKCALSQ